MEDHKLVSINGDYESPSNTFNKISNLTTAQLIQYGVFIGVDRSQLTDNADNPDMLMHLIMTQVHGPEYTYSEVV